DAAAVVRAGNAANATLSVSGNDSAITLVNTGAASTSVGVPANGSAHTLTLNASEIVLGGGTQKILGYGEVNMTAANRIFVAGPGSLTLGAGADVVNLYLATQNVLVGGATASGGGSFAVTTSGNIVLSDILQRDPSLPRRPADSAETGGKLSLTGADILISGIMQAQAGTITLNATAADVRLTSRAYLAAGGYKKSLLDVDTYLSGGKVVLKSDNGSIYADTLSIIDVAQPADESGNRFGYGGEIEATALNGNATFDGKLLGAGGPGLGGRFKLDVKGSADLTSLADRLFDGGVFGAIDIRTRTGNLELSENHTLKAHAVTLTADDTTWGNDPSQQFGQIKIRGRIDATGHGGDTLDGSGRAGGRVGLYAANSVLLAGSGVIDASTTNADERGGDVTIGISWAAKSKIFLQQGTQINVSGGSRGGLSGGTVTFRAPLDGNNDVKIAVLKKEPNSSGTFDELPDIDATNDINDRSKVGIIGARSVAVNGFIAFDTKASSAGIDGSSLGWAGIIDTAGW
ncbi:MAG: hypothetical protein Q7W29_00095, partial [bacterium]|nr:hypothetical protein [bacterium]